MKTATMQTDNNSLYGWVFFRCLSMLQSGTSLSSPPFWFISRCSLLLVPTLVISSLIARCVAAARGSAVVGIPGPKGWPVIGSLLCMDHIAHRRLAVLARLYGATKLMALWLGKTRVVVASDPHTAAQILHSSSFVDRPIKYAARKLFFHRAIGFAPCGPYWRSLRRHAAAHLFSPKKISSQEPMRQLETTRMLVSINSGIAVEPCIEIRGHLQKASLHNIMSAVFGQECTSVINEGELESMVREGFQLLGGFEWGDHLPWLFTLGLRKNLQTRCDALAKKVKEVVGSIVTERSKAAVKKESHYSLLDYLLDLEGPQKLAHDDIIAVLWEMVFRGTDTTAILTEWILARVVLHGDVQTKLHQELDRVVGDTRQVAEADIPKLIYLKAVVKETLRMHPPGPLLSWARLATHDLHIGGHFVPAGTTGIVNMWAITHDPSLWPNPHAFLPTRFISSSSLDPAAGTGATTMQHELAMAPFGAGRRVCPGKSMGMATVHLWIARLLHHFRWLPPPQGVSLHELLKLSCEMKHPLQVLPIKRIDLPF